jgi:2-dehydro-3-deoxyphosphooctonate aldolase (KDO 8-P synthase)
VSGARAPVVVGGGSRTVSIGGGGPLALIAGPCVLEDLPMAIDTAIAIRDVARGLGMPFVFKSSYTKDNRSSVDFYRGPGLAKGLEMLARVREEAGVPVLSDVHAASEAAPAARVLDVLQIPAYLSQQTSLALACGETGKVVNVKKGQFVAPEDMAKSVAKIESTGNRSILLTERGSSFGYRHLVVDMRALAILARTGYPVIFDATHAVRIYGRPSADPSGGEPEFIPLLARAAVAAGCDGVFIETHPAPERAKCDAASQLRLDRLPQLLETLVAIDRARRTSEAVRA